MNYWKGKKMADEKALITPVPLLNQWLSDTLDWCKEPIPMLTSEKKYPDELNNIFRKVYPVMTYEQLKQQKELILLDCISGSTAYNLECGWF
jgi:hypothetical protein